MTAGPLVSFDLLDEVAEEPAAAWLPKLGRLPSRALRRRAVARYERRLWSWVSSLRRSTTRRCSCGFRRTPGRWLLVAWWGGGSVARVAHSSGGGPCDAPRPRPSLSRFGGWGCAPRCWGRGPPRAGGRAL